MKSFARLAIASATVIGACLVGAQGPADSQELPSASALEAKTVKGSEASAPTAGGIKVYIDPQTGRLMNAPSSGVSMQLSPAESNAMSTSHHGLVETLSPRSGGGAVVNLQGRFQSPLIATIDAHGKVVIQHLDADAVSAETK